MFPVLCATREYYSYLMSGYRCRRASTFECVDRDQESIPGSGEDIRSAQLHHVEASCSGMPCPPYDAQKELTMLFAQSKLNTV